MPSNYTPVLFKRKNNPRRPFTVTQPLCPAVRQEARERSHIQDLVVALQRPQGSRSRSPRGRSTDAAFVTRHLRASLEERETEYWETCDVQYGNSCSSRETARPGSGSQCGSIHDDRARSPSSQCAESTHTIHAARFHTRGRKRNMIGSQLCARIAHTKTAT